MIWIITRPRNWWSFYLVELGIDLWYLSELTLLIVLLNHKIPIRKIPIMTKGFWSGDGLVDGEVFCASSSERLIANSTCKRSSRYW